jgi:hypothetical protein
MHGVSSRTSTARHAERSVHMGLHLSWNTSRHTSPVWHVVPGSCESQYSNFTVASRAQFQSQARSAHRLTHTSPCMLGWNIRVWKWALGGSIG